MALKKGVDVKPASGKLGILLPGMGAVATTFLAPGDPASASDDNDPRRKLPIEVQAAILENLNLDQQAFREKLARDLEWDPMKFADRIDARSVLMVLAVCDTIVPFKTGMELRKAIGKPETYFLPTGHLTAFFLKGYIQRKALEFFERKFAEPAGGHPPLATVQSRAEPAAPALPANSRE